MAWDEWEQLKQDVAQRHAPQMQLSSYPAGDGPGRSAGSVTGGVKSTQRAWNKAGEGIGGLREGVGKALTQLQDGQKGLHNEAGCLTDGAQKDVHASWNLYVKCVKERCGSLGEILEKVGHDFLMTDESVRSAFGTIDAKYSDTPAVGGHGSGR
jgi:hypothetical protein